MNAPALDKALDLRGRVALVTGAVGGIGQAIAARLGEAGARIAVHHRASPGEAEALATRIGGGALAIGADLARPAEIERMFDRTQASLGPIDILINNAARQPLGEFLSLTPEQWRDTFATNVDGVFATTQNFARRLIAQRLAGAVVNITSIEAENPAPMHSHYGASKSALLMMTRAFAGELGPHAIRVNAVAPGLIHRPGIESAWPEGVERFTKAAPLRRLGTPMDIADACLFLVSPLARWITGASLTVDGGVMTHQVY